MRAWSKMHPNTVQALLVALIVTGGTGINIAKTDSAGETIGQQLAVIDYRLACLEGAVVCQRRQPAAAPGL